MTPTPEPISEMKKIKEEPINTNSLRGESIYFFCKECGCYIGRIYGWEFKNFANGLSIRGMNLCLECAKKKAGDRKNERI